MTAQKCQLFIILPKSRISPETWLYEKVGLLDSWVPHTFVTSKPAGYLQAWCLMYLIEFGDLKFEIYVERCLFSPFIRACWTNGKCPRHRDQTQSRLKKVMPIAAKLFLRWKASVWKSKTRCVLGDQRELYHPAFSRQEANLSFCKTLREVELMLRRRHSHTPLTYHTPEAHQKICSRQRWACGTAKWRNPFSICGSKRVFYGFPETLFRKQIIKLWNIIAQSTFIKTTHLICPKQNW